KREQIKAEIITVERIASSVRRLEDVVESQIPVGGPAECDERREDDRNSLDQRTPGQVPQKAFDHRRQFLTAQCFPRRVDRTKIAACRREAERKRSVHPDDNRSCHEYGSKECALRADNCPEDSKKPERRKQGAVDKEFARFTQQE